jgi:chromosome segregation ATPase
MAGVGEASAVLAVVQVGLSLATALNTYISDVQDAQDNIQSLVSDIDATFGQLRDLGRLIEKNETVKAWSDDGLRNAKKCVIDCEKVIAKLRKLLKKSTASATSAQVDRDEIDITKLERARWP